MNIPRMIEMKKETFEFPSCANDINSSAEPNSHRVIVLISCSIFCDFNYLRY